VRYDPFAPGQVSAAQGLGDIETIKPRSRDQYVALFKKTEERGFNLPAQRLTCPH